MPFLLLDEIICFYKVTSKYTTKFLAGHYVVYLTFRNGSNNFQMDFQLRRRKIMAWSKNKDK